MTPYIEPWAKTYYRIQARCTNKSHSSYPYYGKKGIKRLITKDELKQLWIRDRGDLMKKPSIDRIDTAISYTYDNCRFLELEENRSRPKTHKRSKERSIDMKNDSYLNFRASKELKKALKKYAQTKRWQCGSAA